ncbi:MAG: M56 family metallopeptidase [Planctomycetota bacterium]
MSEIVTEFDWRAAGLLTGTSVLLVAGTLAVFIVRRPLLRQRLAELSIALTLVWFVMAVVPLPRIPLSLKFAKDGWRTVVASNESRALQPLANTESMVVPAGSPLGPVEPRTYEIDANAEPVGFAPGRAAVSPPTQPATKTPIIASAIARHWAERVWRIYLVAAAALIACIVLARTLLSISVRRSVSAPDWVQGLYNDLSPQLRATVRVSTRHRRPVSFGVFRPVILLPAFLCDASRKQTLRHVLLHEQVHVDRRDAIGNALMNIASPILWFHPLFWYLRSTAIFARELIADDRASSRSDKLTYVNDLLELIRLQPPRLGVVSGGMGVFGFRHPFTRRMSLLLNRDQPLESTMKRTSMITLCALGLLVMLPVVAILGTQTSIAQETLPEGALGNLIAAVDETDQQRLTDEGDLASDVSANKEAENSKTKDTETAPAKANATTFEPLESFGLAYAVNDLHAFSPLEGQVIEITCQPGTLVKKGDVIARLENLSLVQESLAIRQKLHEAVNGASGEVRVTAAEQRIESLRSSLERSVELSDKKLVSPTEIQAIQAELRQAELRLKSELVAMDNAKRLEDELNRQYKITQDRIQRLEVRAPISGIVEEVSVKPSAVVSTGAKLFRVIDLAKVRVKCHVPVTKFNPAELRDRTARVDFKLGDGVIQLIGKIAYIGSTVSLNDTMEVWIDCDNVQRNGDWMIRPGMRCRSFVMNRDTPPVAAATDKAWIPNPNSETKLADLEADEIKLLKELVKQHEETSRFFQLSYENGTATTGDVENAKRDWWSAEAQLAIAEGRIDDADSAFQKAIEAARAAVASVEKLLRNGMVSSPSVLLIQRRATEIQLEYLRFQKSANR